MEENKNCEDTGYKLIEELMEFASQKKTAEEVMHFVNIAFEYSFGATAIMFLHKKYDAGESVKISRGYSNFFIKKINENPPYKIIETLAHLKGGLFIDFKKEKEKYDEYKGLLEHENVSELYAYELKTPYSDSYFVIVYSVKGFKNCCFDKVKVFDTFFSILAYILNSERSIQVMRDCSQVDYVSGLNNFKYFHEKLFQEMQKAAKDGSKLSVGLISINQLNKLNSVSGHTAGDKNISIIANIIKKNIRAFDTASRYGNKFIILFPNVGKEEAKTAIKKIFGETEDSFKKDGQDILSLNAGVSEFPGDGGNERTILDIAEGRRIDAKREKRWAVI